jgi:hypothetical protein
MKKSYLILILNMKIQKFKVNIKVILHLKIDDTDRDLMKVITLDLPIPVMCPNIEDHRGKACKIIKRGFYERIHCYDLDFPFYLHYQIYSCNDYKFSVLNPKFIQGIPANIHLNIDLVVMGKHILVLLCFILFDFFRHKD